MTIAAFTVAALCLIGIVRRILNTYRATRRHTWS